MGVHAVNVPVTVGGMDVAPGDMIHMDENGAVKFPPDRAEQILNNAKVMLSEEAELLTKLRQAKSAADVRKANGQYGNQDKK